MKSLVLGILALATVLIDSDLHGESAVLTISAAASLRGPLESVAGEFEKSHPETKIVYNFGSSGSLKQQIVHGAPVDIFISAASRQMDELETAGFVDSASRFVLSGNTIVLIAPSRAKRIKGFEDLASAGRIAIGEPTSVPAGMYAMEVFRYFDLTSLLKNRLVFAKDVRQVLVYVQGGDADAGLIYGSDVHGVKDIEVVAVAPPDSHTKVEYPAAMVATSPKKAAASDFLKFLRSSAVKAVFQSAGFLPAG